MSPPSLARPGGPTSTAWTTTGAKPRPGTGCPSAAAFTSTRSSERWSSNNLLEIRRRTRQVPGDAADGEIVSNVGGQVGAANAEFVILVVERLAEPNLSARGTAR